MSRRVRVFGILLTVALLFGGLAYSSQVQAVGTSLTTSPVSVNLTGKAGQTVTTTLQVQNNSANALKIAIQLDTFHAQGTAGKAAITPPTSNDTFISWVHFSQTSFIAQPGAWTPVTMTINLPTSASLGYYYAVLFKPVESFATSTPNTNFITGSNTVLVLLNTVSANEKPRLQVASFTASKKVYEYLPATFNIDVRNSGNIYLPPSGDIYITKGSGLNNVIATLDINPGAGNVLPSSDRAFSVQWANGFPVFEPKQANGQPLTNKAGQPVEQLHWNFAQASHFRFGHYYAHLTLVYSNGTQDIPINGIVSFWVIPWKLILIILVPLALIVFALWSIIRKIYKRIRKIIHKKTKPEVTQPKDEDKV